MSLSRQPRRPSLPTVVGSGLAIVAAGSLLAFSSLAEQAGLQGLATGGLRPADPERMHGTKAITIAAPATAPPEPRGTVDELVRRVVDRDEPVPAAPPAVAFSPTRAPEPKARRIDDGSRVKTAAGRGLPAGDERTGPPYGHAYGYHKERGERPEPASRSKKHGKSKQPRDPAPVDGTAHDEPKRPKPPKPKKAGKARGDERSKGHGNGHSKHADAGKGKGHSKPGHRRGKGRGHAKPGHGRGKGKGHSKHGH